MKQWGFNKYQALTLYLIKAHFLRNSINLNEMVQTMILFNFYKELKPYSTGPGYRLSDTNAKHMLLLLFCSCSVSARWGASFSYFVAFCSFSLPLELSFSFRLQLVSSGRQILKTYLLRIDSFPIQSPPSSPLLSFSPFNSEL